MKKILMIVAMALLCLMSAEAVELDSVGRPRDYVQTILGRSQKVTDALKITGTAEGEQVLNIVANRYFKLNDIYAERRRELCFEGHELFDLARTKRGLTRTDYDGSINKDVAFPDYKWAMPIIQAELDANENCVQNEGY